jgi:hypothetical protein
MLFSKLTLYGSLSSVLGILVSMTHIIKMHSTRGGHRFGSGPKPLNRSNRRFGYQGPFRTTWTFGFFRFRVHRFGRFQSGLIGLVHLVDFFLAEHIFCFILSKPLFSISGPLFFIFRSNSGHFFNWALFFNSVQIFV